MVNAGTDLMHRRKEDLELSPSPPAQPADRGRTDPPVLTVDEAATLLRVDRKSIYESIRRGEFPGVVRVGRAIRIGRAALCNGSQDKVVSRVEG